MEKVRVNVFVAMVALLLVLQGVNVYGICNVSNHDLMTCKPAIQTNGPVEQPSSDCCAALQNADFRCLCKYKNSFLLRSMHINMTRAMELPQLCSITTEPITC